MKITKPIKFISVFQIPEKIWAEASQLAFDVDEKDTPYIAFSLFFKALIWSGDYRLKKGLINKGFNAIITTDELFHLRLEEK